MGRDRPEFINCLPDFAQMTTMANTNASRQIRESLLKLDDWSTQAQWKGYDTFDGLSSPLAPIFSFGNPFMKRVWQQGVRRFPMNIRPLLGIKPSNSSKGMGFFAQGYLHLYQTTGDKKYLAKMHSCLEWLIKNRCPQFKGYAWGNHFDYESRSGRIAPGTPTVVWTSLIGHAFLDAYDALQEERYLEVARGIAEFTSNELGHIATSHGDICISYTPTPEGKPIQGEYGIHNSNILGAGFLARLNSHSPKPIYLELAEKGVKFTIRDQMPNGAWNYGNHPKWAWVDSFHTGYNLEALDHYIRWKNDKTFLPELKKGYTFFVETFFEADGTPRYYDYKTRPLDIQCASQAIETLVNLRDLHPRSIETAISVAQWTINNMQDRTGYFYYRKYPVLTNKTPTLHWGQATMFAALALLDEYLNEKVPGTASQPTKSSELASA
jgi:rhamnogalacturonyl hydrolase YesR